MTNTPERYDHHEDGMEIARDRDFVSYDDYAALLSRAEQAVAALKTTLDREAETHRRHDARLAELEGAVWLRVGEVLAGLDHDDVSITAREKIAKAICAAT
jgi:diphthamide biosynthesis methyltransferase